MANLKVADELATAVYNKIKSTILDTVWPIGSVYISVNTTNPSTLFGGGWTRLKSRFLLGADDSTYKNGDTGGEASHTLTTSEMPVTGMIGVDTGSTASEWTIGEIKSYPAGSYKIGRIDISKRSSQ